MPKKYIPKGSNSTISFTTELDLTKVDEIVKACKVAHNKHIRFGWINGKKYPRGSGNINLHIAQVAAWQEFGTQANGLPLYKGGNGNGIPARPYLTKSFLKTIDAVKPDIENYFKDVCKGVYKEEHLKKISETGKKQYYDLVAAQGFKGLADLTIKLKGHAIQMDETGILLKNFDVDVFKTNIDKIDKRA